jgi:hypothetical protein
VDYDPVDIFVKEGDCVAMSRWRFKPEDGEFALEIASLTYDALPGLAVPRGVWSYGYRQTKMVEDRPPAAFDKAGIHTGAKGDRAILLAGQTIIRATADGKVVAGEHTCTLGAPAIHDGMIAAYGHLYVSTADGSVVCVGTR